MATPESAFSLLLGDALERLREIPSDSVDSGVTDPPYGLSDHRPEDVIACMLAWARGEEYRPKKRGFMGRTWDSWVPGPELWRELFRVLKPGAHLLVFAGSRTQDLMGIALRMAGFEIRDTIMWIYGSGFPKYRNIGKAIDEEAGAEREVVGRKPDPRWGYENPGADARTLLHGLGPVSASSPAGNVTAPATPEAAEWEGWATALKPAYEPIIVCRKPIAAGTVAANVLRYRTGAMNVDACRVEAPEGSPAAARRASARASGNMPVADQDETAEQVAVGRFSPRRNADVYVAERPSEDLGRWPANVVHDGSPEVVAGFPQTTSGKPAQGGHARRGSLHDTAGGWGMRHDTDAGLLYGDSGSAARFFYCAKASVRDRDSGLEDGDVEQQQDPSRKPGLPGSDNAYNRGVRKRLNSHPTVKPVDLMRWLVKLVTPPGGVVIDPFMGSGSTGKAAALESFGFIGIEMDPVYLDIASRRIAFARKMAAELAGE